MKLIPKRKYLAHVGGSPFYATGLSDFSKVSREIIGANLQIFSTIYGNGEDGNVTISGNTTLIRDMLYDNLTVNAGVTLSTDGYCIYVKNKLTLNGSISAKGKNASGASAGAAGSGALAGAAGGTGGDGGFGTYGGGGGAGGNSLIVACKIMEGNGSINTNGGNGANASGNPSLDDNGTAGGNVTKGGAVGGAGGGGPPASGAGGTSSQATVSPFIVEKGGAGGGGGGAVSTGSARGGGGGGAGLLFVFYRTKTGNPTFQASGGSAGTGIGGGASGTAGTDSKVYEVTQV